MHWRKAKSDDANEERKKLAQVRSRPSFARVHILINSRSDEGQHRRPPFSPAATRSPFRAVPIVCPRFPAFKNPRTRWL
jgi:hypothetical protein